MFALGEAWHLACVPDFVRSVLMDIPSDQPLLLRDLINELHVEFRMQIRFLEELAVKAALASGAAINPGAVAGGGGPVYDDETIADEDVELVAVEDDDVIVVEDDQPEVGTETNPIVIEDD